MDKIVGSTIRMHLAENVYFNMAKETTTFSLWEKLQAVYEKKSSFSRLLLIKQLFNMKMTETDLATSHMNTFSQVLIEQPSQGINLEEEIKALGLLSSLPESWEVFCMTYANSQPILNLDEITGQALTEDTQRNRWDLPSTNEQKPTT